jgi:hypothetical protein
MAEALEEVLVERVQAANAGLPPRDPLRHSSELGLWSGIRQQVASVAGQVAKEEWQTALKQQPFLWPGPEDVQAVLAEGWERYRDPEESEKFLEARWWEEAKDRWLQQVVAKAEGLTAGQQERFLEECRERLADAEAAELQQRFRKRIQGVSASVRREFAEEQAAPLLEALRELDPLPAGQVEIWMEARDCRAFEDVRALRKEARDLWQEPLSPMLKEAEMQVLEAVNRLMTEAAGIHARQQAIVEALEEDLGASLAADVQAGVPLSDIRKKWMEAFQSRWRPTPDGERYPELFAANERLLEKTLRQWYNRVEAEAPTPPAATGAAGDSEVEVDAEASPSDLTEDVVDPPESTEEEASAQPGSGGMEEIPEAKLEMAFALKAPIVLVVTDTEAAEVQLEVFYGELQQTRRVEVSAATTAEAVDRLVDGLDPGLWADALARVESPRGFLGLRRKPETVSVLVYVESERIPYRTMLMLRERLTEAVEAEAGRQGTRLPQMEWSAVPRPPRMR